MKLFYVLATNNVNSQFVVKRMDEDDGGDAEVVIKSDSPRPPPKGWDEYKHS